MAVTEKQADPLIRRALHRARTGRSLDVDEATALISARGEALDELLASAGAVRDAGWLAAGCPGQVTYSRKVFIPLTRLCRNSCRYCAFVETPKTVAAPYLERDEIVAIAEAGARHGCKEALFTLGDRPELRWPQAAQWLAERGYASTVEYLRASAIAVLETTGLLPHLNPGVLSWSELHTLRPVSASMGMMLETTAERLYTDPAGAHYQCHDKAPAVRLQTLRDAGRAGVPFTTGILIGIGETPGERVESLIEIRRMAREYGNIQEVIVQNFVAKPGTAMRAVPDAGIVDLAATLAVARLLLGPSIGLQAPPNLIGDGYDMVLRSGITDWGGVSPVTADHVNPQQPWPQIEELAARTAAAGFTLRERLPVYPRLLRDSGRWLDRRMRRYVLAVADPDSGLAAASATCTGMPWQLRGGEAEASAPEPTGAAEAASAPAPGGVPEQADVPEPAGGIDYGDWALVTARAAAAAASAPTQLDSDLRDGLVLAERDPAALLEPRHADAALAMFAASGHGLREVVGIADGLRADAVGETVTYVANCNINFSNICYVGCRFCAFAQRERDPDGFRLSVDQVVEAADRAVLAGATEVCMQGGIDPGLPVDVYPELIKAIKARHAGLHIHAYSPMEIVMAAAKAGLGVREWLLLLREAGLDTIPGTAAEILDDDVRWVLTKGKLPTSAWIEVISTAHELGIRSTATMMYGHVDHPGHWLGHLRTIADIQDRTGGFTEFVPLPFVHNNTPLYLAGVARPGATARENRAVVAMARILLHGRIPNIQCSWVKVGDTFAAELLRGGANDLGGTLMEEKISSMAGADHGVARTEDQLGAIAAAAGRPLRRRTTAYGVPTI